MPFDLEGAQRARTENLNLTIFDTGEMLEPHCHRNPRALQSPAGTLGDKTGVVDFDNDEGATVLQVFAHPGALETDDDQTVVVTIDWEGPGKLRINLNDGHVATFDESGERIW